ncbi:PREDICTED: intron-binding protein aquarius [Rhagoletis zephyria]|uniref:intron-binding protein aquarius n=1 Tax=Rhagoletis zephyria TaxID=28612 RepID=UPI000811329E|nr:PREDICTED: intron-binding protein aquarius [Rhagoletis zephyria]
MKQKRKHPSTEDGGSKQNPHTVTVSQISADIIWQLASQYWSPETPVDELLPYNGNIIEDIYCREILDHRSSTRRIMMLEFSQYLEKYLWPNYKRETATHAHLMSIVAMVNEKFRERVEVWPIFESKPEEYPAFFRHVLETCLPAETSKGRHATMREKTALIVFLNHCFNSMEIELCREQAKRLVSLSMWSCLQPKRLEQELREVPEWRKFWRRLQKKEKGVQMPEVAWERHFLQNLIIQFLNILEAIPLETDLAPSVVTYCERFLEFVVDLEALLPTRRFFNTVLDDTHLLVRAQICNLVQREEGKLFGQLLDMLKFYTRFEISDVTGDSLTDHQMTQLHYKKITSLQRAAFAKFPDLRLFALSNVANVDTREALHRHFGALDAKALKEIASFLNLVPDTLEPPFQWHRLDDEFLKELLITRHERRCSQLEALNEMPLYPTEDIIWDENVVPSEYFSGDGCLALPKLNLQFLTLHDYLLRNFNLFRLESTYEIRQDIEDAVSRMLPWQSEDGDVIFGGWARMALPIASFAVVEVTKPHIGERKPSRVRADVSVTLSVRKEIKEEWENLRKHDVCFLITVQPTKPYGTKYNPREPFIPQVGLVYVRGCEVEGMLDANGRVIEDGPEPRPQLPGEQRTYRVWLDSNQYRLDMDSLQDGSDDVYESFNIIMRRKPKENNFKAVLETIRHLMNTECVVPPWLHDLLLGYGDPGAAHYSQMPNQERSLDFNDTFLNFDHLKSSFPGYEIKCDAPMAQRIPPFRLIFEDVPEQRDDEPEDEEEDAKMKNALEKAIVVQPYVFESRGPYVANKPKQNSVRFTPTQLEAIRAGMQPGLTLVVGPPGTGKTDVAVQIISNLYHNHPNQRTLIVTHSNQALNQLFEKIMALDIDERHLLRLGHGEEALETEKDFSRYGRVNYVLTQRLQLLKKVQKLQESLNVLGDNAYTCETAGYFYLYNVVARWEKFLTQATAVADATEPATWRAVFEKEFPFTRFFADASQPLFKAKTYDEYMEIAKSCFRYITHIFTELEEFRAFELLRTGLDRSKYLLVKEAKIIAMTCTHAALKRKELVNLGFRYDNILMEESAQILEIETFIPLLLQNPLDGYNRLKRWIMIGDHHQLPPVIKNMAFQKYSNMEQSLFTRLVRLGVPTVDLDGQGRARSSICSLYKWRYKKLDDLTHILERNEYRQTNAGFVHDYQLINVEDFNGVGETEPNPFFYQNLAEAEYVVAVYMYMRLLGYPAEKISILTTYNGQKHLIRDVINVRCGNNPLIGWPYKVTTVDKYQGQQNDYILISLVRTKAVGHLRDVRRLVVAMSRARLGLYIFGRVSLFKNCFELQQTFKLLTQRPQRLQLLPDETYPTERLTNEEVDRQRIYEVNNMTQMAEHVYEVYMKRMEELKDKLPAEGDLQMYANLPQESAEEVEDTQTIEEVTNETPESDEPPKKRAAKETSKATKAAAAAFKPTPIVNEIGEDEPEGQDDAEAESHAAQKGAASIAVQMEVESNIAQTEVESNVAQTEVESNAGQMEAESNAGQTEPESNTGQAEAESNAGQMEAESNAAKTENSAIEAPTAD